MRKFLTAAVARHSGGAVGAGDGRPGGRWWGRWGWGWRGATGVRVRLLPARSLAPRSSRCGCSLLLPWILSVRLRLWLLRLPQRLERLLGCVPMQASRRDLREDPRPREGLVMGIEASSAKLAVLFGVVREKPALHQLPPKPPRLRGAAKNSGFPGLPLHFMVRIGTRPIARRRTHAQICHRACRRREHRRRGAGRSGTGERLVRRLRRRRGHRRRYRRRCHCRQRHREQPASGPITIRHRRPATIRRRRPRTVRRLPAQPRHTLRRPGCRWAKRQVWVEGVGYRWRPVQVVPTRSLVDDALNFPAGW